MSVLSGLFFKEMYELLVGECQPVRNNGVSVERGSIVVEQYQGNYLKTVSSYSLLRSYEFDSEIIRVYLL